MTSKQIIGKTAEVGFPELGVAQTYARIDTGAKTSAIWVDAVNLTDDGLEVVFFGAESPHHTGKKVLFPAYAETVVASSNGALERRYKVRILITIGGRRIRAWFTLADRSSQVYPVLVGRNILRGKFLVDVSIGTEALRAAEKDRTRALREIIEES